MESLLMYTEQNINMSPHVQDDLYNIMTFLKEIDWTEPWLIGLVVFHAVVTILTLVTRNHGNFQAAFFFLLCAQIAQTKKVSSFDLIKSDSTELFKVGGLNAMQVLLVFCSENLNEVAAKYWMYFARQQYFDSSGMFISIMFSAPLLLNCLVMVGQWLWTSGNLMVKLKQAQLKQQLRAENKLRRQRGLSEESIVHN